MSVEAWIIEEREKEERRRREDEAPGIHLPRTPGEAGPQPEEPRQAAPGRVEVVEISPPLDGNVIDL
jgi:hypothetical protein